MENLENGLIGIGEKNTDFILGGSNPLALKILEKQRINRQPVYEYNQGAQYESRNWCTVYSAVTQLSYLFDREFSYSEIKVIADRMIADGKLDPDRGAYLSDAIDYTRKWWNEEFPERQVESYQIDYLDSSVVDALKQNVRLTQIGYRTSSELRNELQTNGYAMGKDYPKVGGHAVCQYGINTIDNYKGRNKFNRYSFHNIQDLIKNGVIFRKGYLYLMK